MGGPEAEWSLDAERDILTWGLKWPFFFGTHFTATLQKGRHTRLLTNWWPQWSSCNSTFFFTHCTWIRWHKMNVNVVLTRFGSSPVWAEQLQVTASLDVSDKPAPEACWVSLWTVCHRCTLDPAHRITWRKLHLHAVTESQMNSLMRLHIHTNLRSAVAVTNTVDFPLLAKHGLPRGSRHQSQVLLQRTEWNVLVFLCRIQICFVSIVSTCRLIVSAIFFTRPSLTVLWIAFCLVMALVNICLTSSLSCFDWLTVKADDSKTCLHSARRRIHSDAK